MARRGVFGRLPSVAPSLTSTIVSIAREMQAREDQNIMDAWQKGGMFEGKPATDERVLAYWQMRLKGVDKNDPLADTYRDTVTQYEYAIAESKMTVKYAQGKISDGAAASFYLGWAKKIPPNTEFYRVLQRDAAQYLRAAAAKGRSGEAAAKEKAYADAQNGLSNKYEKVGGYLTDVAQRLAFAGGITSQQSGAGTGVGELRAFNPDDPGQMLALLNTVNAQGGGTLYTDPATGKMVTGADVLKALHGMDPHFDGRLTLDYYRSALSQSLVGEHKKLDLATSTGHATDANRIEGQIAYNSEIGREASMWPVEKTYDDLRSVFLQTFNSPSATPQEKLAAWNSYSGALRTLANGNNAGYGGTVDDNTKSRLLAEADGNASVDSMAENFTGLASGDHSSTGIGDKGDIAETHAWVDQFTAEQKAVADGQQLWVTGVRSSDGSFKPQPGGKDIGAASLGDIQQSSALPPQVIFVPQKGAATTPVIVLGVNVDATVQTPDGQAIPTPSGGASANVATAYDITIGGVKQRIYGFKSSDGQTYYTKDAPWGANVQTHDDSGGVHLTYTLAADPATVADLTGTGLTRTDLGPGGGSLSRPRITADVSNIIYNTDPTRAHANVDPATDFLIPTFAALVGTPDWQQTYQSLKDDPTFKAQVEHELTQAATDQQGIIHPDQLQNLRNNLDVSIGMAINPLAGKLNDASRDVWDRSHASGTFQDAPINAQGAYAANTLHAAQSAGLPADQVRKETPFAPLASAFEPGTNLIRRPGMSTNPEAPSLQIKTPTTLTVAAPPPTSPVISPISGNTVAPAVTQSVAPGSITQTSAPAPYSPYNSTSRAV